MTPEPLRWMEGKRVPILDKIQEWMDGCVCVCAGRRLLLEWQGCENPSFTNLINTCGAPVKCWVLWGCRYSGIKTPFYFMEPVTKLTISQIQV